MVYSLQGWLKVSNFAAQNSQFMAKSKQIKTEPTAKQLKEMRLRASTPLKKVDDALSVNDIIRDDAMLIKVHFVSDLMVKHASNSEISAAFEANFGEPLPLSKVSHMKQLVRAVYMAEISKNKDEMVAEELMHAEWELRELQDYWEKSKHPKKKNTHHVADSDGTDLTTYKLKEDTDETIEQIGDLNAMKYIANVRERVIRLLGLEAPKQQNKDEDKDKNKTGNITINIVGNTRMVKTEDAQIVG